MLKVYPTFHSAPMRIWLAKHETLEFPGWEADTVKHLAIFLTTAQVNPPTKKHMPKDKVGFEMMRRLKLVTLANELEIKLLRKQCFDWFDAAINLYNYLPVEIFGWIYDHYKKGGPSRQYFIDKAVVFLPASVYMEEPPPPIPKEMLLEMMCAVKSRVDEKALNAGLMPSMDRYYSYHY
jgi:hypothetical protein